MSDNTIFNLYTSEEIDRAIDAAFSDLDPIQLKIHSSMSSEKKARIISANIRAVRKLAFKTERDRNPHLSDVEIHKRALARFMRFSEWEPEERERFIQHMDRVLPKYYAEKAAREAEESCSR